MIKWNELNGTEQFVVETTLDEIERENVSDKEEIMSIVYRWANEYGWANEEMGEFEEANTDIVFTYVCETLRRYENEGRE